MMPDHKSKAVKHRDNREADRQSDKREGESIRYDRARPPREYRDEGGKVERVTKLMREDPWPPPPEKERGE